MESCNPTISPLPVNALKYSLDDYPRTDSEVDRMLKVPYIYTIGKLMYRVVSTNPHIANKIRLQFFRYFDNPSPNYWEGLKQIFKYLKVQQTKSTL